MYGIEYDKRYEFWKVTGTSDPVNNRQYKTAQGAWHWIAREYEAMHKRAQREMRRCEGKFIPEDDSYSADEILTDYQNEIIAGTGESERWEDEELFEEFENDKPEAVVAICTAYLAGLDDDYACEEHGDWAEKQGYPRKYGEVKLGHEVKIVKEMLAAAMRELAEVKK